MNQIADFLLHLFKERNLQPTTIEGYRTAIADMVGNDKLNISKDENLTHLLDNYIPRRKSGIYWIQVRRAAAVEISLWTR